MLGIVIRPVWACRMLRRRNIRDSTEIQPKTRPARGSPFRAIESIGNICAGQRRSIWTIATSYYSPKRSTENSRCGGGRCNLWGQKYGTEHPGIWICFSEDLKNWSEPTLVAKPE